MPDDESCVAGSLRLVEARVRHDVLVDQLALGRIAQHSVREMKFSCLHAHKQESPAIADNSCMCLRFPYE